MFYVTDNAYVYGLASTCNLYTDEGCERGSGIFSYTYTGLNNVPNSMCRRTYQ